MISSKSFTVSSLFSTLQLSVKSELRDLASGITLFFKASPKYVKANSAPAPANFYEMPQAIDLSFATPIIRPFLPFIKSINYIFSNIKVALVPPKPKLLDITEFNVTFFSTLVTIGKFFASSSNSVIFAEAAIKLFFIMIKQ